MTLGSCSNFAIWHGASNLLVNVPVNAFCSNTTLSSGSNAKISSSTEGTLQEKNPSFVTVSPNPSNGNINIQCESRATLTLNNSLGQLIRVLELGESYENKVVIKNLPNGVYFLNEMQENIHFTKKIVITN